MRIMGTVVLVAGFLATVAVPADAQRVRPYADGGYVVAESWWGKGTVSGPVRRGPVGWQVRLPGGTWIDCVRSCAQTLRQQSIDFWESNGPQAKDSGPGYFRREFGY
jgi:hypothetical protein